MTAVRRELMIRRIGRKHGLSYRKARRSYRSWLEYREQCARRADGLIELPA
jgi:hypothetical protein